MELSQSRFLLRFIILGATLVLLLSLFDIIFELQWLQNIVGIYGTLILFSIILLFIISTQSKKTTDPVSNFKKRLEGKLCHYKCPNCSGIFAVKKSKLNNNKKYSMTCPECGYIGAISPNPKQIFFNIPKAKSESKQFICKNCGESVTVWAEGSTLLKNIKIYSCPYCGINRLMAKS